MVVQTKQTLLDSLYSTTCPACGNHKREKQTFCGACYHELPKRYQLTLQEICALLNDVRYLDRKFEAGENNAFTKDRCEQGYWLRVIFEADDSGNGHPASMHGRKWIVSRWATRSEVVQTASLAIKTAVEHELRESFTYRGAAIFGPHFDAEKLVSLCRRHDALDSRFDLREGQHAGAD